MKHTTAFRAALAAFALLMAAGLGMTAWRYTLPPINSADAKTIADAVYDVGPVRAQAIVDERAARGPFLSWTDFAERMKDKDIGPAITSNCRWSLRLGNKP